MKNGRPMRKAGEGEQGAAKRGRGGRQFTSKLDKLRGRQRRERDRKASERRLRAERRNSLSRSNKRGRLSAHAPSVVAPPTHALNAPPSSMLLGSAVEAVDPNAVDLGSVVALDLNAPVTPTPNSLLGSGITVESKKGMSTPPTALHRVGYLTPLLPVESFRTERQVVLHNAVRHILITIKELVVDRYNGMHEFRGRPSVRRALVRRGWGWVVDESPEQVRLKRDGNNYGKTDWGVVPVNPAVPVPTGVGGSAILPAPEKIVKNPVVADRLLASGVVESKVEQAPAPPFDIVSVDLDRELERLHKLFCPAMVFAGQFLSDWCFLPPARIHDAMLRAITLSEEQKHILLIGPRSFAKTTIALIAELFDGLMLNRLSQTHMSVNQTLADKKVRFIIQQIEENRMLQAHFGLRPAKIQRVEEYHVKVGLRHPTEISFSAKGFGGTVRGERESRIFADDIDDAEANALVWRKNYDKLHGTVMGALRETDEAFRGQVVFLGNYLGDQCTAELLETIDAVEDPDMWEVHKFSAIELGPTQKVTKVPVGRSVWPELMSTKKLMQKRRTLNMGEAWKFELEYMNLKVSAANRIWEREMFEERYDEIPPRHRFAACMAVDPTDSQHQANDDVGIVSIAKCYEGEQNGFYYVLDTRIAKLTPREVANEALRQYVGTGTKGNPICDTGYLEDKSNKGIGALQEIIQDHARANNVNMNIHRVVPKTYGDKRRRALKVVDLCRQGRILFPKHPGRDMRKLIEQLMMFTGMKDQANMPAIDDGVDAFVWCLLMLRDIQGEEYQGVVVEMGNKTRALGSRVGRI